MIELIEKIATRLGFEDQFRAHGHHVPRMARVLAIGGIGALWQFMIFETLGIWWGIISASTAAAIGAMVAIFSNFTLNERYSFSDSVDRSVPWRNRIAKFYLVSSGSLATQWVCVFIAEHISTNAIFLNLAFLIGVGLGFIFNYSGYYFFVWRRK